MPVRTIVGELNHRIDTMPSFITLAMFMHLDNARQETLRKLAEGYVMTDDEAAQVWKWWTKTSGCLPEKFVANVVFERTYNICYTSEDLNKPRRELVRDVTIFREISIDGTITLYIPSYALETRNPPAWLTIIGTNEIVADVWQHNTDHHDEMSDELTVSEYEGIGSKIKLVVTWD